LWEGARCPPIAIPKKVLLIEYPPEDVRERALALFVGKARRAVGLDGDVVVLVTNNEKLRRLNRQFRCKDEATDVLSFASHPNTSTAAGDLAISAEIAAANAAELGHSTETELKILILHGLLHLAGYDHERDNGEMRARETELRSRLGLPVGLIERAHGNGTGPASVDRRKARAERSRVRGRRR